MSKKSTFIVILVSRRSYITRACRTSSRISRRLPNEVSFFCLKPPDSSKNNRRKEAEFYGFVISQKSYQRRTKEQHSLPFAQVFLRYGFFLFLLPLHLLFFSGGENFHCLESRSSNRRRLFRRFEKEFRCLFS